VDGIPQLERDGEVPRADVGQEGGQAGLLHARQVDVVAARFIAPEVHRVTVGELQAERVVMAVEDDGLLV